MKRKLLSLAVALLCSVGLFAQASYNHTYTSGVEVAAGSDYFLYNIGSGMFLTEGMDYGTHATVDHAGRVVTLAAATNGFSIYSTPVSANGSDAKAGYLFKNGSGEPFVDGDGTSDNKGDFIFTSVSYAGYTNVYTIKIDDSNYLYHATADGLYQGKLGVFLRFGSSTADAKSYWLIIPKSARQDVGDYTYLLRNTDFHHPWELMTWSNTEDWTNTAGGLKENPCAEMYGKGFDISQTISETVANGKYKLYNQAFYNNADGSNQTYLYANTNQSVIALLNANGEGTSADMAGASTAFTSGQYVNSVETLVTDRSLKVGLKNSTTAGNAWSIMDNFYLEYLGNNVEYYAPTTTVFSEGKSVVKDTWYACNISAGNYRISADAAVTLSYTQDGTKDVDDEDFEKFVIAKDGNVRANLTSGTLYFKSSADGNITIEQVWANDANITSSFITNPSFENGTPNYYNGWTVTVSSGSSTSDEQKRYKDGGLGDESAHRFYIWTENAGAATIKQTLSSLPAGNYKLSAYMSSEANDVFTLTAGGTSKKVIAADGSATLVEVYFTQDTEGNVDISAKHSNAWFSLDNFQLTYNPTLPASLTEVSGKMKGSVSTEQSTAISTYNTSKTFANLLSAQTAMNNAVDSRIVYNNIATIRSNYETKAGALDDAGQSAYSTATNVASTGAETMYYEGTYTTASEAETAYSRDYITAVKAQTTENTDMTEAIVNPSFESATAADQTTMTGWTNSGLKTQNNTAFAKAGTYYVEQYHVSGDKYIKQTLTGFHSGVYTLTAVAHANGNTTSPKLYVKVGETESSTAVSSSKDYSVSFNYDGTSTLEIGFSATLDGEGWVCVDNFRLTYDAAALPESLTEVTGYMNADVRTAANTAIATYNSSKTLENYSAAQAAITDAEASRAVYVTINGLKTTYQGKADALDAAGQAAYTTAINTASTGAAEKYENGTYVTALEAELAFMADLAAASKTQTTAGANMTGAIINNSFETGTTDGWTYTASNDHGAKENSNDTYKMTGVDGSYLFNIWSTGNAISQTLTGMPAGTYRLTAVMGTDKGTDESHTLYLNLGGETGSAASVDKGTGVVVSVEKTLATAGDLTVGADAGGSQWYKVDNFQLTYLGISKNLTVAAKAGKYGTIIFPFTPNVSTGYDNITFYSCNSVSGEVLQLSEVDSPAANTPYIIKNEGGDFSLNVNGYGDRGLNDSYTSGFLTGVYTASTVEAGNYVLQTQSGVQGFYKVNGDGLTAIPYRAYLTVPSGVKAFFFDATDGINNLNVNDDLNKNEAIYNLAGQRVQKAIKGLYIKNGKKVVIK